MCNFYPHHTSRDYCIRQKISRNFKKVIIDINQCSHRFFYISNSKSVLTGFTLLRIHITIYSSLQESCAKLSSFLQLIFQNRMKRSASSTSKENTLRGCQPKNSYRHNRAKEDKKQLHHLPVYNSKQNNLWNTLTPNFYNTFSQNNFLPLTRPESKQAFRKCVGRPQTSKGVRPLQKTCNWQRQSKAGFYSQWKAEEEANQGDNGTDIAIIVTQSGRGTFDKAAVRSKFQTDLDDQFLQLFAN